MGTLVARILFLDCAAPFSLFGESVRWQFVRESSTENVTKQGESHFGGGRREWDLRGEDQSLSQIVKLNCYSSPSQIYSRSTSNPHSDGRTDRQTRFEGWTTKRIIWFVSLCWASNDWRGDIYFPFRPPILMLVRHHLHFYFDGMYIY